MFRSAAGTKKATRAINELGTRQDGSGQAEHVGADCQGCGRAWLPLLPLLSGPARSLPLASRSFWACLDSVLSRLGLDVDGGEDLGLKSIVDSMK